MPFDAEAMRRQAILTPETMARVDARTIAAGTPRGALVARAAQSIFRVLRSTYARQPVTILAGPGYNGEDGLVLAQLLLAAEWPIEVMRLDASAPLDSERFGDLLPSLRPSGVFQPGEGQLVVDALFGAGLSRPLDGEAKTLVDRLRDSQARVVAVDLPSGVDGATGAVLGAAAWADCTITFHRLKPGHVLGAGAELCGRIYLKDIGLADDPSDADALWNHPSLWRSLLSVTDPSVHKYQRGHLAVIGGPGLRGGAARLAARAATVCGSGAVSYLSPVSGAEFAATHFDAVMVRALSDDADLSDALNGSVGAAVIGPGMGHAPAAKARLLSVLAAQIPTVVDADALTLFEKDPSELLKHLHSDCVLTPHEGEFARLFSDIEGDKLSRAEAAAERSGAVVLLKGASTVIAAPGHRSVVSTNGSPALATAGSGDCLAGVIGALLAQGVEPLAAAAAGAWIHAEAGSTGGFNLNADALPARIGEIYSGLMN